jgi:predicted amidohydrolase YtcJ
VAPLSPVLGIHAAATRSTLDGKHPDGWFPRQRISAAEALRAYTAGSAYAGFAESDAGVLAPGKLADLAVLDRDILDGPPEAIAKARVDATLAGGRWVFLRASNVLP